MNYISVLICGAPDIEGSDGYDQRPIGRTKFVLQASRPGSSVERRNLRRETGGSRSKMFD